ncbi:MAG: Crp/Fnr family transcriptional regulator [Flammeovirgaceae bacterium]|nr:Crp/Fnr family transcriptional regulator [Flammeovirgaceae bacterium]MBE62501.1 Crp/Fnr family transcriptional regulator [Flammeovirgaceae bacterium]MBR08465.1 Crp/Fnr family transcriptional regulator [Rickettsiales bacterium]HCX22055.1 Crp/Fnr family transcriptional regulator [Cytophagales bacterium]|tara:strand:- start:6668 stop:7240 length:573 start_codon:yes stop_codon:yes gene_type:complete
MNNQLKSFFSPDISSQVDLDKILSAFESVSFDKKEYIFTPDQVINHYYFIESGFARSFVINMEGNEVTTEFFSQGNLIIDWPAFFMRNTSTEYYQASTPIIAWKIGFDSFQELFHSIADFRESGRARLVKSFFMMKKRHLDLITKPAKERYLTMLKLHPEVFLNASLKDIATYLGITDTSLSRIRKELSN